MLTIAWGKNNSFIGQSKFVCKIFCYCWICLVVLWITHILQKDLGRMLHIDIEKTAHTCHSLLQTCLSVALYPPYWFMVPENHEATTAPTELKYTAFPGHTKARFPSDQQIEIPALYLLLHIPHVWNWFCSCAPYSSFLLTGLLQWTIPTFPYFSPHPFVSRFTENRHKRSKRDELSTLLVVAVCACVPSHSCCCCCCC